MKSYGFIYRFRGVDCPMTVEATDLAEAQERIKSMGMARYEGEIYLSIPRGLSLFGIVPKIIIWLKKPEYWGKKRM